MKFKYGGAVEQVQNTVTAAGTTILTVNSKQVQNFTGTTTQTVRLPDATTMKVGQKFEIYDSSTGALAIIYNDTTAFTSITSGSGVVFKLVDNSTSNGLWVTLSTGAAVVPPPNFAQSASCGQFSTTSGTFTNITNLQANITTVGKPVLVKFNPVGVSSGTLTPGAFTSTSYVQTTDGSGAFIRVYRDSTAIFEVPILGVQGNYSELSFIDTSAPAGLHSYLATAAVGSSGTIFISNFTLIAMELK